MPAGQNTLYGGRTSVTAPAPISGAGDEMRTALGVLILVTIMTVLSLQALF